MVIRRGHRDSQTVITTAVSGIAGSGKIESRTKMTFFEFCEQFTTPVTLLDLSAIMVGLVLGAHWAVILQRRKHKKERSN